MAGSGGDLNFKKVKVELYCVRTLNFGERSYNFNISDPIDNTKICLYGVQVNTMNSNCSKSNNVLVSHPVRLVDDAL